jgi:hypothetical protein
MSEVSQQPPAGFGKSVNDFLIHHVSLADAKAGAAISIDFTVSGLILAQLPDGGFGLAVSLLAVAFLLASLLCGIAVVFPRTSTKPNGVIFWEGIRAKSSYDEYLNAVRSLDEKSVELEFAEQNWHISGLLESKFEWTQRSLQALLAGMLIALLSFAVR